MRKTKMAKEDTFISLTNQKVYDDFMKKFETIEGKLDDFNDTNTKAHEEIKEAQRKGSSRAWKALVLGGTALTIALISIMYLFNHVNK